MRVLIFWNKKRDMTLSPMSSHPNVLPPKKNQQLNRRSHDYFHHHILAQHVPHHWRFLLPARRGNRWECTLSRGPAPPLRHGGQVPRGHQVRQEHQTAIRRQLRRNHRKTERLEEKHLGKTQGAFLCISYISFQCLLNDCSERVSRYSNMWVHFSPCPRVPHFTITPNLHNAPFV